MRVMQAGGVVRESRRGYCRVELVGRRSDEGFLRTKRGVEKHLPLRANHRYFEPIAPKRVRAVILEEHDREPSG